MVSKTAFKVLKSKYGFQGSFQDFEVKIFFP